MSKQIFTLESAMAGLRRIASYFDQVTEQKVYDESGKASSIKNPSVEIDGLSFSYNDNEPILKNVSISISFGKKIAFAGRTGAGKTTLMNLIAGLYSPDGGRITIEGVNPFLMNPKKRRKLMGVVSQELYVLDGTIIENITMGELTISEDEVKEAIKLVGLKDDIEKLDDGYNTLIGEGNAQFSKGQKQLLCSARAIFTKPQLLLLDELTARLDMKTEEMVLAALKNVAEGRTIITISHRLSGIIDADYVYLLNKGEVVEEGNLSELNGKKGLYAMMLRIEKLGWQDLEVLEASII